MSTSHLALPFLAAAQAQKHITHNEALIALDALVHLAVIAEQPGPPSAPQEGDRYLIARTASGGWASHAGQVAAFQEGAWNFYSPRAGWIAWLASGKQILVHDGSGWADAKLGSSDRLGINATADATNRLAVASAAVLFTNVGAGSQIKVNKATTPDTASLLFQTGYAGRAEMGLAGNDAFAIKVSADGTNWREAIQVESATTKISGRNADLGSEIALRVAPPGGSAGVIVETASRTGATLADITLQTELHSVTLRNEGRDAPCLTGKAPEFQVRFSSSSPLVVAPQLVVANAPLRLKSYARAALPSAATAGAGAMVYVADDGGGAVPAFSDGASWRRVTDRTVVS